MRSTLPVLALVAMATQAAPVKDIRTVPVPGAEPGSDPQYLTPFQGGVAFSALRHGERELWFSDGTPAGTQLICDVRAGPPSSNPRSLTVVNGLLFFTAVAGPGDYDYGLFASDGTAAGTRLVYRLYASEIVAAGTKAFFVADDPTNAGWALWVTDGTTAGTQPLRNISTSSSAPNAMLTAIGSAVFFRGSELATGFELWRSDGTPAGTGPVKDIAGGTASASIDRLTAAGSTLFFTANNGVSGVELWKSDGTDAGTVLVKNIHPTGGSNPTALTAVGSTLFFFASDGTNGLEPWTSDGTDPGTVMLKNIRPGSASSFDTFNSEVRAAGDTFYFTANDGTTGLILWKSDGTAANTVPVVTTNAPRSLEQLTAVGSTLYFIAWPSGLARTDLFKSDGTAAGTVSVATLPFVSGVTPEWRDLTGTADRAFFSAVTAELDRELWSSDGTTAGTVAPRNIEERSTSSNPGEFAAHGDFVLFAADDGVDGNELWRSDGTNPGTVKVASINPGAAGSDPRSLVHLGGVTYFAAEDSTSGTELWRSDGTTAGTYRVKDIYTGSLGSNPFGLVAWRGALYFYANGYSSGLELWRSDGTEAGTQVVRDINVGTNGSHSAAARAPDPVGDFMLFEAWTSATSYELWRTDGTAAGTAMVRELRSGNEPASLSGLHFVPLGPLAFFITWWGRSSFGYSYELWRTDGTNGGTVRLGVWPESPGVGNVAGLAAVQDFVLFVVEGHHLWRSDGTPLGTYEVMDWAPARGPSYYFPDVPVGVGARAFFIADDGVSGRELWVTDGTSGGTSRVTDLAPGLTDSAGELLLPGPNRLWFTATDAARGLELWSSDGTAPGTRLEVDLAAGNVSANPGRIAVAGGTFYFAAGDASGDREPHLFAPDPTPPVVTPSVSGQQGTGGWYTSDVSVSFTVTEGESPVTRSGCDPVVLQSDAASITYTCSAQSWGGTAGATVTVKRDATPPVLQCQATVTAEATSAGGTALSSLPRPAATDALDPAPTVTVTAPAQLPLGDTTASASAVDHAGNTSSCTFVARVRDTTAPALQCPTDQEATAADASGAAVTFAATATDAADGAPELAYSHAPGSVFPAGSTEVTVTAADDSGNQATCRFQVRIQGPDEEAGCGCGKAPGSPSLLAFALALLAAARATRRRAAGGGR